MGYVIFVFSACASCRLFTFLVLGDVLAAQIAYGNDFQIVVHELCLAVVILLHVLEADEVVALAQVLGGDDLAEHGVVVACQRGSVVVFYFVLLNY